MNESKQKPLFAIPPGFDAMPGMAKDSFEAMSKAYSAWLRNANKLQAETIRFVGDRFNKDLQMLSRFGSCRKPEEFMALQTELVNELISDYLAQSAKLYDLLSQSQQEAAAKSAKK